MSIHVIKCGNEYHLRYPGLSEADAQSIADKINAGALDAVEKLEAEHLAQIAGLRDALKLAEYAMSSDGAEMPIAEWRKIEYEINCAMIDTQQTADAFVARVRAEGKAEGIIAAAHHIECAGQNVAWHHAAKDWPTDARVAIKVFSENQAVKLRNSAAQPEGGN